MLIYFMCQESNLFLLPCQQPDQKLISETCNVFRQLTDIYDSWGSVIGMIDYFGDDPQNISQVAGPGAWNDPDQVT